MSIFKKKDKVYLGAFLRLIIKQLIDSKTLDIKTIDEESFLSNKEVEHANAEILDLRFAILAMKLTEKGKFGKKQFSSEEIGHTFSIALALAFQDTGKNKEEALSAAEPHIEAFLEYYKYLEQINEKELAEKGPYFFLIRCYEKKVLGKMPHPLNKQYQDKSFVVFHAGKQVFENDNKGFPALIKEFYFLD